jgi:acyl-coenzyme A synthetase/AMP-(fatty) acid ligase
MGIDITDIGNTTKVEPMILESVDYLVNLIMSNLNWKLTLHTSGTTGIPKKVSHPLQNLIRFAKVSDKHTNDVWGFAYHPTHIAGIQVFFQAILNSNPLIELFDSVPRAIILDRIIRNKITNLSATPTFYRLLFPLDSVYPFVTRITSGGERLDEGLISNLAKAFPNALIRNVYASTEAGTILSSHNDMFSIRDPRLCTIVDNRLMIHRSLLGGGIDDSDWYDSGDVVEIVSDTPLMFKFMHRDNEMINVGGYKVNPNEIENALRSISQINDAYVYGKKNSLVGNLLIADIVLSEHVSECSIREALTGVLQPHKLPRVINVVKEILRTRSGKVKRVD